jgi:hypothetical protein
LAGVLSDPRIGNFVVQTLVNRPSFEILREIETFFAERKKDDLILLYFSGHGVKDDDGRLYLATTDTRRGLFRSTAVPSTFINETMTASRSRRQVLVLDCCHSGAFARGMVAKGGESVDIRERFEGRGRVVLTASNATQYAFQGDEIIGQTQPSIFTRFLVRGLETGEADSNGDGWVSLDELYDYVYDHVLDETPQQTPGKWTFDVQGDILIAASPRGARDLAAEDAHLAVSYADGLAALTSGQWKNALAIFEGLEAARPGYRDCTAQIARLQPVVSAMEARPTPHPEPLPPAAPAPKADSARLRPAELPETKRARPTTLPEE